MKNIFTSKVNAKVRPNDIIVKTRNLATYGDKSLTALGPKIWNKLPENIKSETRIKSLRNILTFGLGLNVDVMFVNS